MLISDTGASKSGGGEGNGAARKRKGRDEEAPYEPAQARQPAKAPRGTSPSTSGPSRDVKRPRSDASPLGHHQQQAGPSLPGAGDYGRSASGLGSLSMAGNGGGPGGGGGDRNSHRGGVGGPSYRQPDRTQERPPIDNRSPAEQGINVIRKGRGFDKMGGAGNQMDQRDYGQGGQRDNRGDKKGNKNQNRGGRY